MRSIKRILTPLAALAVVLALVGVVFALHAGGAGNTRAASRATAATPPDAVHVVVTHYQSYSTVLDPRPDCPANTTCYTTSSTPSTTTVYDKTFTDAAIVRRLQSDLNAPPVVGALLPDATGRCGSEQLTYTFTFTASGQAVEQVAMRAKCDGIGLRAGYAPDLTLGTEQAYGSGSDLLDVLNTTYGRIPTDGNSGLSNITSQP